MSAAERLNAAADLDPEHILKLIRRGISDPGASVKRGDAYSEPVTAWGARAVLAELDAAGLMMTRKTSADSVLSLPPEPPVGTTVKPVSPDALSGHSYLHREMPSGAQVWQLKGGSRRLTWPELLHLAGPAGVRVLPDGEERP